MKKKNIPITFTFLTLIFGSLIIFFVKPVDIYDSGMQYYNAYALATGQVITHKENKNILVGQDDRFVIKNQALITVTHDWLLPSDQGAGTGNRMIPLRAQYPPINWLPQAIGLKIGMLIGQSSLISQQLARFVNLLVYIFLFLLSIFLVTERRSKRLLACIGLIPQGLYLGSSLSADAINIAWCVLFVAYFLHLYEKKRPLRTKQTVILAFLGLILFWLKVAYAPLLLLVFVFDKKYLPTVKKWLLFLPVFGAGSLGYLLWTHASGVTFGRTVALTNSQVLLQHPLQLIGALVENLVLLPYWLLVGNGRDFFPLYTNFIVLVLVLVAFIYLLRQSLYRPKGFKDFIGSYRLPLLSLAIVLITVAATFLSLMLSWIQLSKGYSQLDGFQARYLLPLLPLLAVIFYFPKKSDR